MGYQHTTAYNDSLGITAVAAEMKIVKQNATDTTEDDRRVSNLATALSKYYGMTGMNVNALKAAQAAQAAKTESASQAAPEAVA